MGGCPEVPAVSEWMEGLTPEQLALLIPLIAIALSDGLSADEVTVLGTFISSVGDVMQTIGAQLALLQSDSQPASKPNPKADS